MERLLLRVREVQEALGLSRSKTYGLIASGELQAIRIGTALRVTPEVLRAYVQKKMEE